MTQSPNHPITYPTTKTIHHVEELHGEKISDPYRWLEEIDSAATQKWIKEQNALTFSFLEKIPQREKIRARLTELWNFPRVSTPFKRGKKYFQFRNTGLQNQDVLFVMDSPYDQGRVLLEPKPTD
ncbi:MAG: hypothetical protein HY257_02955 [Chloroflexi bacterium]|nr:hypothetical protein [Chloroflexota bacterium]